MFAGGNSARPGSQSEPIDRSFVAALIYSTLQPEGAARPPPAAAAFERPRAGPFEGATRAGRLWTGRRADR